MNIFFTLIMALGCVIHLGAQEVTQSRWGIITAPVADMLIKPSHYYSPTMAPENFYRLLPLSVEHNTIRAPRAHQALFNEIVKIIGEHNAQVHCEISSLFYDIDDITKEPLRTFWTLKKNILALDDLDVLNLPKDIFPSLPGNSQQAIVLTYPFTEPNTQQTYSLGTIFTHVPKHDTATSYGIIFFDAATQKAIISSVPHTISMEVRQRSLQHAQQLFVTTLNTLIDRLQGVIPFVWGGSSFIHEYTDTKAETSPCMHQLHPLQSLSQESLLCWKREEQFYPASGFDASELVFRIATMCGIPYPYKTTAMAEAHLTPLNDTESIIDGDLLWTPGSLMILSSEERHELIMAAGYISGYGKVVRTEIEKVIKDINTYEKLLVSYRTKQPLVFLAKNGLVRRIVNDYKILRLCR